MISIEALLLMTLTVLPAYLVGASTVLASWPLVVGVALASLIVSVGFSKDAARRIVDMENQTEARSLELEREQANMERAELSAKSRRIDYERQLLRREGTLIAQERRELVEQRQKHEKKAGELIGARLHIKRLRRGLKPKDGK